MDIPRYRIGNDLTVLWAICNNDGTPFDMSGKEVRLFVTNERGIIEVNANITTDENSSVTNVIRWDYLGEDQKVLGKHTLTVEILTSDDHRKIKRDICDAFTLVPRSDSEETGGEGNAVDSGSIYLSTKLDVYRFGKASVEIGPNGNWFIDGTDTGKTAMGGGPGLVSYIYKESDLGKEFNSESVIDTFNAHAINAIYSKLKNITIEDIQNILFSDVEAYDVLAFNGNTWMNIPFRTIFGVYSRSESSSGGGGDVNLEQIQEILNQWKAEVIDPMWQLDDDGNVVSDKQVIIKNNLIVEEDTGSGGEGEDTPSAGLDETRLQEYLDEHKYVTEDDIAGLIPSNIATVDYVNTKFNSIDLSPYAKTTELNALTNRVVPIETWMDNVGQHITYDAELDAIVINHNLIVTKDTSSGGEGEDTPASGSGGIDEEQLAEYLESNNYVNSSSKITSLLGYTPANGANYLPLSGGTITSNANTILTLKGGASNAYSVAYFTSGDTYRGYVGWNSVYGFGLYHYTQNAHLGITNDGIPHYNGNTLLHSGNIGSYNAGSATKLATARTIWGQSFDGTNDVSGMPRFSPNTYSSSITTSSSSIVLSSKAASMNGYNTGIALAAIGGYDSNYQNHLHAWIGLGATTSTSGAELYPLVFATNNSTTTNTAPIERMRIMPNGNVLIGTAEDSGYKLDVYGTGRFTGVVTMSSTLSVTGASYWYHNAFFGAGKEGIYISSSGQSIAWHNTSNSYVNMLIGFTASSISVYQNLRPDANNSHALGTNSYMWKGVYTPLLQSAGGLDIVANGGGTASRLWLTTNCFRPWSADAGLIDLGLSSIQWRNVYAVNGIFSGDTSSGSDVRFKDIIENKTLKIEDIAKAPLFTFKWNDREDDTIHLGSSAQYWEKVCPWLVSGEDFKTLNYATLGVAMGISLAKKTVNHEARIKALEKENKELKETIRRMEYGG